MKIVEFSYRYDAAGVVPRPLPADANAARDRLDEGSRTIAALLDSAADGAGTVQRVIPVDSRDLGRAGDERGAYKQHAYAAVLGCSDARVPIELIFNEGPNDLFVVRVAGNGLDSEVLGSLNYAVDHLGESLKLIVVLGHSGCGAVSAAVEAFLEPWTYLGLAESNSPRTILDRVLVVVQTTAKWLAAVHGPEVTRRSGYREVLIEAAIVANAVLAAYTVQQEMGGDDPNGLRAVYGVDLCNVHQVWAPRGGSTVCAGLALPPADLAGFDEFGRAVVRSDRIAALCAQGSE